MKQRLLTPKDIPLALITDDGLLCLPQKLREAYFKTLEKGGLLERARKCSPRDTIGGRSRADTDQHLAHKFSGSCSRVELAILDPKNELGDSSDGFIRAFSGGRVSLLDIPCGCCAASATVLSTIAELRRQQILPRQPLEVFLTGGDFSSSARTYAGQILDELERPLRNQGIFLKRSLYHWDINDEISNTELLSKWLTERECDKALLLIVGFSGVLGNDGKIKKVRGQLAEAIRWAGVRQATITWIEPQTKKARKMWDSRILKGIFDPLTSLPFGPKRLCDDLTSEAKCLHPLCDDRVYTTRLLLNQWRVHLNESTAGNLGQTGGT